MTIPPVTPSPDDKDPATNAAPAPDQTDPAAAADTSSEESEETRTDKEAEKIIDVFSNSPYVSPKELENMEEHPDEVVKLTQTYGKQSRKSKQDLEATQKNEEKTIQSYAPPDSTDPTQTSKQKGS